MSNAGCEWRGKKSRTGRGKATRRGRDDNVLRRGEKSRRSDRVENHHGDSLERERGRVRTCGRRIRDVCTKTKVAVH